MSQFQAEVQKPDQNILWAVDEKGVITLFRGVDHSEIGSKAQGFLGRSVYEIFKASQPILKIIERGFEGENVSTCVRYAGRQWEIHCHPLRNQDGQVLGLVGVANRVTRPDWREDEHQTILSMLSALRKARTRQEMPPLIINQITGLFSTEAAALTITTATEEMMVVEAANGFWESLAGKTVKTPLPDPDSGVFSDLLTPLELQEPGYSISGIPLVAEGILIGVLWLATQSPFSPTDLSLLGAIREIIANAIHRATQAEEKQRRLNHLAALHEIDRAITSNTDLHVTLNIILAQAVRYLEVDGAAVFLLNPITQRLEYATGVGFPPKLNAHITFRIDECIGGRSLLREHWMDKANMYRCPMACRQAARLKAQGYPTCYGGLLHARGQVKGILEVFHSQSINPADEWFSFFETIVSQTAIAIDNLELFNDLQRSNAELSLAYDATLEGWVRALDLRDKETEGHTQRVTAMTVQLAQVMGLQKSELANIRRGALLHDIGKMGISDSILNKTGPLSDDEWDVMKRHPVYAYNLLYPIPFLRDAIEIPYYHHERWNGSGYPVGLSGGEIPLAARIFAVVDVWDALLSNRPYRRAWAYEDAKAYLLSETGKHFDPGVVEKFFLSGLDKRNGHYSSAPKGGADDDE